MSRIILASTSPRRKELLERAGIDFVVESFPIDEVMDESLPLEERMMKLAIEKAQPIHRKHPDEVVIGADTIVYFQDEVIGKAKNEVEAREILKKLSGNQHQVYTGVAVYIDSQVHVFVEKTTVYFKNIEDLLDDYIASGEWQGKAGAYGIQGAADCFVDHVEGDRDNVIGLPVKSLLYLLKKYNVIESH